MRTTLFEKRIKRVCVLGCAMLTLSACETLTGSVATEPEPGADTYCRIAKPITWSVDDTDATIREVKAHNATGVALCGWGG